MWRGMGATVNPGYAFVKSSYGQGGKRAAGQPVGLGPAGFREQSGASEGGQRDGATLGQGGYGLAEDSGDLGSTLGTHGASPSWQGQYASLTGSFDEPALNLC